MIVKRQLQIFSPLGLSLVLWTILISRTAYLYFFSDAVLVEAIPDDAFYYLQLAHHRLQDGFWTFDGTAPATGFHLLYGYLLVSVLACFGDMDWRSLFLLISMIASSCIAGSAFLTAKLAQRSLGGGGWIAVYIPYLTPFAVFQATSMMESWLVLSFAALTVYLIPHAGKLKIMSAVGLIAVGMAGSLSRSDYGMLPGITFCILCLMYRHIPGQWLQRSALVLAGAILGVFLITAHSYLVSGHFAQASAQVKLFWSHNGGHHLRSSFYLLGNTIFPYFRSTAKIGQLLEVVALAALFAHASYLAFRRPKDSITLQAVWPGMVGLCVLIAYFIFYKFNSSALAPWYVGNLVVPAALFLATLFTFAFPRRSKLVAGLATGLYGVIALATVPASAYPHQSGMLKSAIALRHLPTDLRYGAWNAGILSYFSGKPVINLDGLTNDDLLPYIRSGTLRAYLQKRGVDYIVDYEIMVKLPRYRIRGGYADPAFLECLDRVAYLDGDSAPFQKSKLALFAVKASCKSPGFRSR